MTFGLRCSGPACRPHPASLPVRVPTVEGLPPASFGFPLAVAPCGSATVAVIGPIGSFHPTRVRICYTCITLYGIARRQEERQPALLLCRRKRPRRWPAPHRPSSLPRHRREGD